MREYTLDDGAGWGDRCATLERAQERAEERHGAPLYWERQERPSRREPARWLGFATPYTEGHGSATDAPIYKIERWLVQEDGWRAILDGEVDGEVD